MGLGRSGVPRTATPPDRRPLGPQRHRVPGAARDQAEVPVSGRPYSPFWLARILRRPKSWATRMPMVMKSCGTTPRAPLRFLGASSPRYIGTTLEDTPGGGEGRGALRLREPGRDKPPRPVPTLLSKPLDNQHPWSSSSSQFHEGQAVRTGRPHQGPHLTPSCCPGPIRTPASQLCNGSTEVM